MTYRIQTNPCTNAATVTCTCGEPLFTRPCQDDIPPRWEATCDCGKRHECRGSDDGDLAFDGVQERVRTGFAKPELAEVLDVSKRVGSMYRSPDIRHRLTSPVPTREG